MTGTPRMRYALVIAAWLVGGAIALAQTVAPMRIDPRIRIIPYQENQIVPLRGHLGYQMLVEFDPNERIENVAIGDSLGWQVTPNRAATLLFVKPIVRGASTNMTVVTTLRRYAFELTAREATGPSDPSIIYSVRFTYPAPPPPAPVAAPQQATGPDLANLNLAYSTRGGGRKLPPVRVFDDGKATYFQFAEAADAAAIYVIGADGREELVNAQWRGPYMVVEQVAHEFVLRVGRASVRIRNDGWREPAAPTGEARR